jgi:hypothetical protein
MYAVRNQDGDLSWELVMMRGLKWLLCGCVILLPDPCAGFMDCSLCENPLGYRWMISLCISRYVWYDIHQ